VDLERKSASFDESYDAIESKLEMLHSIYRSYATLEGDEYILKLKALVSGHRNEIEKQKISFNVIHFLLEKIQEYETGKITRFPAPEIAAKRLCGYKPVPAKLAEKAPFKWISFQRNGSWFLAGYTTAEIIPSSLVQLFRKGKSLRMNYNGEDFEITDLFSSSLRSPETEPAAILTIRNNGFSCYAADRTGKKIIASTDILIRKAEPFSTPNARAYGFVRIAGTRYILLKDAQSSADPRK
jgi:hypothetical protein